MTAALRDWQKSVEKSLSGVIMPRDQAPLRHWENRRRKSRKLAIDLQDR